MHTMYHCKLVDSANQTRISCTLSLQTCHRINTILERNHQILAATTIVVLQQQFTALNRLHTMPNPCIEFT